MKDLEVDNEQRIRLKELEDEEMFISVTSFNRAARGGWGSVVENVRRRTIDPFISTTLFGTRVRTFPSEWVYRVREL